MRSDFDIAMGVINKVRTESGLDPLTFEAPDIEDRLGNRLRVVDGSLEPAVAALVQILPPNITQPVGQCLLNEAQVRELIARLEDWLTAHPTPEPKALEFALTPIKWSDILHTNLREMAHEAVLQDMPWEAFRGIVENGPCPLFLLWLPTWKRAGLAWPDPGPKDVWTTAADPEDAVRLYLRGELLP